jgi:hypothetical protein
LASFVAVASTAFGFNGVSRNSLRGWNVLASFGPILGVPRADAARFPVRAIGFVRAFSRFLAGWERRFPVRAIGFVRAAFAVLRSN